MAQTYEQMDAIALLKADHRKVEEIFAAFEKATQRRGSRPWPNRPAGS